MRIKLIKKIESSIFNEISTKILFKNDIIGEIKKEGYMKFSFFTLLKQNFSKIEETFPIKQNGNSGVNQKNKISEIEIEY